MPGKAPTTVSGGDASGVDATACDSGNGVLMFDATLNRVVSINERARSILGLPNTEHGAGLDAAMPGLIRLRELARSDALATGSKEESLLFWSRRGAQKLMCRISPEGADGGLALIRVTINHLITNTGIGPISTIFLGTNGHAPLPDPDADPEFGDNDQVILTGAIPPAHVVASTQSPPRNDAETMQQIGQRIRDGLRASTDVAELTAANEPAALPEYLAAATPISTSQSDEPLTSTSVPDSSIPQAGSGRVMSPELELAALLSRAAHEIKTPLSAIAAASEVMRDEHLGPLDSGRYRSYADGIHANARHALDVIDRLLKLPATETPHSVPAQDKAAPSLIRIGLNALVAAAVRDLQLLAQRSGVRISAVVNSKTDYQFDDPVSVKQTLNNLIANALKFTGDGGTVSVETHDEPGEGVRLVVRDTGRGMTRAMAARLVNPELYPNQVQTTATGRGFGFEQVRNFVRDAGAILTIDSTLGKGTSVEIALPVGNSD